ncbi:hypothetical protein BY996DRAFT_7273264 [Phakopsora pachyrhizi]|uniref:LCCL domain-containing protein n=1 Tax=Phakopsora pachyrhizi TaxID=170000 RepID=A0AAV0AWN9_PHAPC|nr:hypothetical protein BY996DRAFT_7273264 [Phakopsora pachyrhizi]CAH7673673.1 hypothetical protein PPACK8108_LOCUS8558 [Phakopsora pachyrhizi]
MELKVSDLILRLKFKLRSLIVRSITDESIEPELQSLINQTNLTGSDPLLTGSDEIGTSELIRGFINDRIISKLSSQRSERLLSYLSDPGSRQRSCYGFLLLWFITDLILIHRSWYISQIDVHHHQPESPEWLRCESSFWLGDDDCGIDGLDCQPFERNKPFNFRCPSRCDRTVLMNPRVIGDQQLNYQNLVIGGGNGTSYRSDSFICQAAIHSGLVSVKTGGCGSALLLGSSVGFEAVESNGISSISFPNRFPSSFKLQNIDSEYCDDLWYIILITNVVGSVILTSVFQPDSRFFFWVLCCVGFWTVVFSTEPNGSPPSISRGFGSFLPFIFLCYWIGNVSFIHVAAFFGRFERLVFYLIPWWFGVSMNLTVGWIPIDRLTVHDITQRPGGLLATLILGVIVLALLSYQTICLKRANCLKKFMVPYACVGVALILLMALPHHLVRLHHYIIGILFIPLTSVPTRPSAIFQSFLLGMIQNGVGRWSFASIVERTQEVFGDDYELGRSGSVPELDVSRSGLISNGTGLRIVWGKISEAGSVGLMVDDVLRYVGAEESFVIPILIDSVKEVFIRLAFYKEDDGGKNRVGTFSKPVTFLINNQTWIKPNQLY